MNESRRYVCIDSSLLPEAYKKVLQAKELLESKKVRNISDAVKETGISRSTFYKYKDLVYENTAISTQRNATFFLLLSHVSGVLSNVLALLSDIGANILTISQSLPIGGVASVTLTVEISGISCDVKTVVSKAKEIQGVKHIELIAMD